MYKIIQEPKGPVYQALLRLVEKKCGAFSLVFRDQFVFTENARKIEKRLAPFMISQNHTDEWPGTKLIGHKANVIKYRLCYETLKIIGELNGIYQWLAPEYPEDLAFYQTDGQEWLVTISHEKDTVIKDRCLTIEKLIKEVPGLEVQKMVS